MSPSNPAAYEPVEDRLREFWHDHPFGRILTEKLPRSECAEGEYIFRAEAYIGNELRNDPPTASGYASEFIGTSQVNKTSALENCETSAIGRALANMGYAPKGKRPSREEMQKASAPTSPPASEPATGSAPGAPPPTGGIQSEVGTASDAGSDPGTDGEAANGSGPATPLQWDRLMKLCGGSKAKAVSRINKANHEIQGFHSYGSGDVIGATSDEVARAIAGTL